MIYSIHFEAQNIETFVRLAGDLMSALCVRLICLERFQHPPPNITCCQLIHSETLLYTLWRCLPPCSWPSIAPSCPFVTLLQDFLSLYTFYSTVSATWQNLPGCDPVSYTHLDVYKRQVYHIKLFFAYSTMFLDSQH